MLKRLKLFLMFVDKRYQINATELAKAFEVNGMEARDFNSAFSEKRKSRR